MVDEAHIALVEEVFGAWLNASKLHGCSFATWAAKAARIHFASFFDPPTAAVVQRLTDHIQVAAGAQKLALAIFPTVETEKQLRQFIELLDSSEGWTVSRLAIPGRFAVDIRWALSASLQSSVTGFGPFGTMPVTRRAPYVAVALWPVGFTNPQRKRPDAFVGVGDMAHDLSDEKYQGYFQKTRERVKHTRDVLRDASLRTGTTFCLSE